MLNYQRVNPPFEFKHPPPCQPAMPLSLPTEHPERRSGGHRNQDLNWEKGNEPGKIGILPRKFVHVRRKHWELMRI